MNELSVTRCVEDIHQVINVDVKKNYPSHYETQAHCFGIK